jgi:hypothetical protein
VSDATGATIECAAHQRRDVALGEGQRPRHRWLRLRGSRQRPALPTKDLPVPAMPRPRQTAAPPSSGHTRPQRVGSPEPPAPSSLPCGPCPRDALPGRGPSNAGQRL